MPQTKNTIVPQEDFLAGLNPSQRQAVTHGEGPALVLAGPGSGKTTVIVKRIFYLIRQQHIPPEEILVVTFTKDAAQSMQQRFLSQTGRTEPVNFGTFHSVFYHILLQSHTIRSGSTLLTQPRKKEILLALLKERKRDASETSADDVEHLLNAIALYKNTRDADAAGCLAGGWRHCFLEIFEAYQRRCRADGGIDFDDMVFECRRLLLENEAQRKYWQGRFSHILIDEFQDINPLQYEVIKLLGERHGNLFAVGDDDQAIYGFRGSSPACLQQFAGELQARRIILNANYRSTREIVTAAEKVIAENRDRFAKECYAAGEHAREETGSGVVIHIFPGGKEELQYLKTELQRMVRECPGESCGVLFRTNGSMQILAALLAKEGIPFRMKERVRSPYEHFIAKDIMDYLTLASGERKREVFLRVMNRPMRYLSRECLAGLPSVDFQRMRDWYAARGGARDAQAVETLWKLEKHLANMRSMSPGLAVLYLCNAVGYEAGLKEREGAKEHLEEWLEVLDFLKEDAKGYESVKAWEEAQQTSSVDGRGAGPRAGHLRNGPEGNDSRGHLQSGPEETGGICLMTVHASKGLEFDRVYLPDCNEKVYPYGNLPDREAVEEERRVFYVGMTRAKKHLELLCTTGTRERPRLISRFLNPLTDHSSISSSNSQLSRYSSKASATFSYSSSSSI